MLWREKMSWQGCKNKTYPGRMEKQKSACFKRLVPCQRTQGESYMKKKATATLHYHTLSQCEQMCTGWIIYQLEVVNTLSLSVCYVRSPSRRLSGITKRKQQCSASVSNPLLRDTLTFDGKGKGRGGGGKGTGGRGWWNAGFLKESKYLPEWLPFFFPAPSFPSSHLFQHCVLC